MSCQIEHADRTPWPKNFPDVVTLCPVVKRDATDSYLRAKYAKNPNQADELMSDMKKTKQFKKAIEQLKTIAKGEDVIIVPIKSVEMGYDARSKKKGVGSNPLPMAIALAISDETGWDVDTDIVQKNIVGHTGADPLMRIAHPALFSGDVQKGKKYIVIDDHVSMGGTMANARGYIEKHGGEVIAFSSLSASRSGLCTRLTPTNKNRLTNAENFATIGCHSALCEKILGYPIDCLTNGEASQIFYHLDMRKKQNTSYNLQNLFNEVIGERKKNALTQDLQQNKQILTQNKLSGTYIALHAPRVTA